ncbi:MAG: putative ABC exporter domain-containing protein [Fimbriimonadaceae bacterium]|nr:hypothetical protein [Chthonomonadaceae bacterium]MCO5297713.1 putative ABC exporter domain-containing protein [Fimbriimonadaceae bacterium]
MRPLVYLTVRSLINGVRRALTSPQRLIGLLAFVGWYFLIFLNPARSDREIRLPEQAVGSIEFPPMAAVDAVVFTVFAGLSLLLALGMFGPRQGFKPADVDVLFPTPISTRLVLVFRIVREYLVTLIVPLLVGLFTLRPVASGWEALFRNVHLPGSAGLTGRMMFVAWIAMALCWVAISYAASLFVNRSDLQSDRNKRVMVSVGVGLVVGVVAFVAFRLRGVSEISDAIDLAHEPVLRVFFFTSTLATMLVMAPLEGNLTEGLIGLGGLLFVIVGALRIALTQADWLYDQAAAKTHDTHAAQLRMRQGDYYGTIAAAARAGKVKAGRRGWMQRLRMQGPLALLWKEILLQLRGARTMVITFLLLGTMMSAMPALLPARADRAEPIGVLTAVMQGIALLAMGMGFAQMGSVEVLKRVDLQKPLPFPASTTVFVEIAAKALPSTLGLWFGGLVALLLRPSLWTVIAGTSVMAAPGALLVAAMVFLMTVLFPDVEDPTQRSFRNLMTLLGIAVTGIWSVGIFGGLWALGISPALAAIPAAALNLGLSIVAAMVAGRLYSSYNPSE